MQRVRKKFFLACLLPALAFFSASTGFGHYCGPQNIVMGVGDLRYYWITADVIEYQPSLYWIDLPGDETIAYVPTNVFSQFFFGFYPIQGLRQGTTSYFPEWAYPPNGATNICFFTVTVLTNPPMTAANYPMSAFAGDPNNAFTCEHIENEGPIFDLGGPMPLRLELYYASALNRNLLVQSSLGVNWSHNFDTRLVRVSNRVDVVTYKGVKLQFQSNGAGWQSLNPQAGAFQLLSSGNNLVLGDRRQNLIYTFDTVGELISISDGKGNVQTLTYSNNVLTQVSDGLGRALNFQYTGFQLLSSVDDGTRTVYFNVDPTHNTLAEIVNPLGGITLFAYDTAQPTLLTAKTLPNGNTPQLQIYDTNGCVVRQIELGAFTNSFVYSNGTAMAINPQGEIKTFKHNSNGQLTQYIDEANRSVAIQSNTNGQRTAVKDRLGNSTFLGYDPASHKVSALTNADGSVVQFSYSTRVTDGITFHDLAQVTYPDSTTEQFTYDAMGNVITRRNRDGQTWSYTYNDHGQVLAETNPMGGVTKLTYNPDGTLASSADSDLGATLYFYDALKRLVKIVHPDGTSRAFVYDQMERLVSATDERTNTYQFAYDLNGNVTNLTDPASAHLQFAFDGMDRLVARRDRLGAAEYFAYDSLGHLASVTNRIGEVCFFTYDALGRPTGFVDPSGKTWSLTANAENLATGLTDPLGDTISRELDAVGNVTGMTNPLGAASSMVLNATREVVQHTDELLRNNSFEYNPAGRLTNLTVPRLGSMTIRRNALGVATQVNDFNGASWSYGTTSMGRPNSFGDPLAWFTRTSYTSRGLVGSTTFADGITVNNSYDPGGNLLRALYSDGTHLDYGYDVFNRVISANGVTLSRDPEGRVTNWSSWGLNSSAVYNGLGLVTKLTYPVPSLSVSYSYDWFHRVTNITDSLTGTYLRYSYDIAGRCTNIFRSNGVHGFCSYNAAGEPIHLQEGSYFDWQIGRDPAGQPSQIIWNGPDDPASAIIPGSVFHNYNLGSQISDPGFKWDWQGRLMNAPGRSNSYDGASRLKMSNGTMFQFDGFNNVTVSVTGGNTNWFLYNHASASPGVLMGVYNASAGSYTTAVVNDPSGVPLWTIDLLHNNTVSFLHLNPGGSVAGMTDSTGALTDKFTYSPLGSFTHIGTGLEYFTFKAGLGWKFDSGANLYHDQGRFYDPALGIHYTPDLSWPRLSEPKANPYSPDLSYRLAASQYKYERPREADILQTHLAVPVVNEFNVRDYLRNQNPEDAFGFQVRPVERQNTRLLAILPRSGGRSCCCCCCCCCCCDCCCDAGPSLSIDYSHYTIGGLYSPLQTSQVSRGLTQSEATEKFVRAIILSSFAGPPARQFDGYSLSSYGLGGSSWNIRRLPITGVSAWRSEPLRVNVWEPPRGLSDYFRSLVNTHLNVD